tara:strand:+ start:298 stop:495 length:198 start_codon:yes stop_codon:yes gene_type:complete
MYDALKLKYQGDFASAKASVLVYFNNPVGIGEHPQHIEEMDKLIATMVDAHDKFTLLEKEFSQFN